MYRFEARQEARADLFAATLTLVAEFANDLPAGSVIRCVARSREALLREGVRHGLADAAVAMARHRLSQLVPARS
jgi:hypothetical protein